MILIILFILTGLLGIKTFFYSRVDTLSFQVLYDCIVYNTDQYYKSLDTDKNVANKLSTRFRQYQRQFVRDHRLLSLMIPKFIMKKLIAICVWIDSWLKLDRIDKKLFINQNKMRLFPHANIKSRTHVLLFVLIIDIVNFIVHIFTAIVYIIGNYLLISDAILSDLIRNSFIIKVHMFIEVILFIPSFLILLQCSMLLSCSASAAYQVFHSTLNHLNKKFLTIYENSCHGKQIGLKESKELRFIYRQHNILCYYEIFTDKDVWSQALYYYALVSIPINVTFMCELIFEDLIKETQLLFVFLMFMHAITGLIPLIILADVSKDYHAIKKNIPAMQLQLKRRKDLRLKLKFDDLYERLVDGKKIAYTFGYLGVLTYRGLLEAFLGYIAAFFLIVGFYTSI
ncbi:uncharacterized protein LOC124493842 [Dermatophagoides farinae]|uniref:uncharacterized protein LOC124493842 n=1 Tax=Dermatophagoides farinae TaxID=6954 RepID=UPI003F5DD4E8